MHGNIDWAECSPAFTHMIHAQPALIGSSKLPLLAASRLLDLDAQRDPAFARTPHQACIGTLLHFKCALLILKLDRALNLR